VVVLVMQLLLLHTCIVDILYRSYKPVKV